jgi:dTDP-4-dehydrorhamnose 3,5-epimerase
MELINTPIPDLLLLKPRVFGDARGYFFETFRENQYRELGISCSFVQDNTSRSAQGVLRGLHFQTEQVQDKLITVLRGQVYDVAVDLRPGSSHFGEAFGTILNDENHLQMFVPKGFAHGFYVMSEFADFYYKCSDYYAPEFETGIHWNDPDLKLNWPLIPGTTPTVSPKDALLPRLRDLAR